MESLDEVGTPHSVITGIVLSVNILGFFVPTGGYALLPFYSSIVLGVSLTVAFLILRRRNDPRANQSGS